MKFLSYRGKEARMVARVRERLLDPGGLSPLSQKLLFEYFAGKFPNNAHIKVGQLEVYRRLNDKANGHHVYTWLVAKGYDVKALAIELKNTPCEVRLRKVPKVLSKVKAA